MIKLFLSFLCVTSLCNCMQLVYKTFAFKQLVRPALCAKNYHQFTCTAPVACEPYQGKKCICAAALYHRNLISIYSENEDTFAIKGLTNFKKKFKNYSNEQKQDILEIAYWNLTHTFFKKWHDPKSSRGIQIPKYWSEDYHKSFQDMDTQKKSKIIYEQCKLLEQLQKN